MRSLIPVTLSQASLYFAEALSLQQGSYNQATVLRIEGPVPDADLVAACHRAWHAIPALRLRLGIDDWSGQVVSWFHDEPPEVPIADLSDAGSEAVARAVDAATRRGIDADEGELARFSVLRTGREAATLLVVWHHLVADGVCHLALAERVARCVVGDVAPDDGCAYTELVEQIRAREQRAGTEQREYWFERVPENALRAVRLPCRTDGGLSAGGRAVIAMDAERTSQLRAQAAQLEVSVFKLLIGAIHHALPARQSGQTMVCTAASQRPDYRDGASQQFATGTDAGAPLIGCFVNMVPLRAMRSTGDTLASIVRREAIGWQADLRRRDFPFAELARRVDPLGAGPVRLDSVMAGYRTLPRELRWTAGDVTCSAQLEQSFPTPKAELSCRILDSGETMQCEVQWGRALAEHAGERFAADLDRSLWQCAA